MLRLVFALLLALVVVLPEGAAAQQASCTCASRSDAQAFERAGYVFEARAIAPVQLVIPEGSAPAQGWSFVVTGVAKGAVAPEQLVALPPATDPCSVVFERDVEYLVLADDRRSDLPAAVVAVDACGGTRLASADFDAPLSFRPPEPLPVHADTVSSSGDPLEDGASADRLTARDVLVLVLIIGGAGGAGAWIWRGRAPAP